MGPYLTAENFVRCVKLILLLGLAALTGLYHLACNFLPAVNKTLLALGTLIQKATPFLMACLDTINKIIGATFLMIHRIWTDFYHGPRSQPPPRPTIKALDMPGTRYWSRQSVSERENLTSGNLYLEGQQTSGERPRYPYLRRDVNRPYMREWYDTCSVIYYYLLLLLLKSDIRTAYNLCQQVITSITNLYVIDNSLVLLKCLVCLLMLYKTYKYLPFKAYNMN